MNLSTLPVLQTKNTGAQKKPAGLLIRSFIGFLMLMLLNSTVSFGQSLLNEDLTALTTGNLGGQTGWTQAGSGPVATVANASPITYGNGYPGGGGNYAVMPTATGTTSRCYRSLSSSPAGNTATNTFYYSFLLNLTTAGATGDYFITLGDPTVGTNYFGKVFAKASGAGYVLGMSKTNNIATAVLGTTVLNFNQTYLIVCRYSFVTGSTNDLAYLWVNPNILSEPTTVSAEVNVNTAGETDAAAATVGNFVWHNRTAQNPTGKFDDIKVSVGTSSALAWSNLGANTINGAIAAGEYGTHTDGQNQNTNSGNITYMNWDASNLYIAVSGPTLSEGFVIYLDKDPQVPVDGGTNANGTLIGQNYDGASFAGLPWRADLVMYVKTGYREYRTATGSNTWSAANTSFGAESETGTVREFAIPWSVIGGQPAAFNFVSYNVSSTGFVYNTEPTTNATGFIGTSARYERYYTVSTTSTPPFSRNSFVFNNTADENSFGAINVWDFTMNSSGRFISRTGATGSNWTIANNLVVGNGTIFMGSGGTNGAYGTTTVGGNLDLRGGTLDMDQTTSSLDVTGNMVLASTATLKLSGNNFGGGDLKLGGNWTNNGGVFTPQTRAVFLNGSAGDQTITGATNFDYLIIDKTAGNAKQAVGTTIAFNATSGNVLQIRNTGGLDLNGNAATFNNSGGSIFVNGARSITSTLAGGTVQVNNPKTIVNNAGVGTLTFGSNVIVQIANSGTLDFGNAISTVNGTVQVIGTGAVTGNSPAYGSGSTLSYNASTYTMSLEWPATNSPTNVTISSSTLPLTMTASRTVTGTLTLSNGILATGANTITIPSTATIARITGYINGNLQRGVATGTNTYLFPVGTGSGYYPASLAFTGVGTGGNITIATINGVGPNYPTALNATKKLGRYWSASNAGVAGFTASATFTYDPADLQGGAVFGNLRGYEFNGGNYTYPTSTGTTSTSFTYNDVSNFGEFGAGECKGTLAPTFTKTQASSCGGGADGTITVTPAGGTGPYTYSWSSNPAGFSASTAAVTGLSPRDYTVVVSEVTTCSSSIPDITIYQALAPTVTNNGTQPSSCANDGSIIIYGANGVPGYTYSVDGTNYFVSNTFTGLAPGTYTAYVKDMRNCVGQKTNIVLTAAAAIAVTASTTSASSCANNGTITLYRTGGVAPYMYSLDDVTYFSSSTFTALAGNTSYTGWVRDSKGCKTSLPNIAVSKAATLTASATSSPASACANDGVIKITGNGGSPGYTYSIFGVGGPYQASNTFANLAPGTYTAWVQDSRGCKNNTGITVGSAPAMNVTSSSSDAGGCNNAGKIQLFVTGGTGPYMYSLDNTNYFSSNTFTNLPSGTYTGYVKDSKTCVASQANITVTQNTPAVSVTESHTNSSTCANDGTIQLRPAGGVAPYTYSLDNITYQGGSTFTGKAAGSYTGYAKDVNGCTASVNIVIGSSSPVSVTAHAVNATACENINGSIQLFPAGGTGPYMYSLDNITYQAGNNFTGLAAGTYTGYVKDSKNCVGSLANITVGPNCPAPPFAGAHNNVNATSKASSINVLKVQAYPNPSAGEFTLQLEGFSSDKLSIVVTDVMGKVVYKTESTNKQSIRFGNNLMAGIYLVQVVQGAQKQSIKVIKE